MPRFPFPRALALFTAAVASVSAVAAEAPPKTGPSTVSVRFLKFSEVPALCVPVAAGKYRAVEAHPGFLGRPVRVAAGDSVPLYRCDAQGGPVFAGERPAPPLGAFRPVEAPRQIVVLFGDDTKIAATVVADTPNRFPYGRVLAVNLTDAPFLAEIGGTVSRVPPGGSTVCDAPGVIVGGKNMKVALYAADAGRRRFYSSMWVHDTKVRTLAFVFKNEAGQTLVRTIVDEYAADFEEAPAAPAGKK